MRHRIVQLSDPHSTSSHRPLRAAAAQLERLKGSFDSIVISGDIIQRGHADAYADAAQDLAALGELAPLVTIPGNHDDLTQIHDLPGYSPGIGVHDLGPIRLVSLDSNPGRVTDRELAALDRALDARPLLGIVLVMHHPPFPKSLPDLIRENFDRSADLAPLLAGRVRLVRALAPTPRVLLLDEALSALDEPLRDQLRVELKALTLRMGLTVIHVTHDRDEALALADRIAVLDAGRIVQLGTASELLHTPATPFVASFLSDATLLPGTVSTDGFVAAEHPLQLPLDQVVVAGGGEASGLTGSLAVLPGDVELAEDAAGDAEVVSALFGRTSSDVLIDWAGLRLRCESSWLPTIGTRVRPEVHRAIFYAEEA